MNGRTDEAAESRKAFASRRRVDGDRRGKIKSSGHRKARFRRPGPSLVEGDDIGKGPDSRGVGSKGSHEDPSARVSRSSGEKDNRWTRIGIRGLQSDDW